jgi:hypothetical protein
LAEEVRGAIAKAGRSIITRVRRTFTRLASKASRSTRLKSFKLASRATILKVGYRLQEERLSAFSSACR